jgi:class 3 adenylate cyclase
MSFDLGGNAMTLLMQMVREAPAGRVVVSDTTRQLAGEEFLSTPAGVVMAAAGAGMAVYNVEKRAA